MKDGKASGFDSEERRVDGEVAKGRGFGVVVMVEKE